MGVVEGDGVSVFGREGELQRPVARSGRSLGAGVVGSEEASEGPAALSEGFHLLQRAGHVGCTGEQQVDSLAGFAVFLQRGRGRFL